MFGKRPGPAADTLKLTAMMPNMAAMCEKALPAGGLLARPERNGNNKCFPVTGNCIHFGKLSQIKFSRAPNA
jgi:hypothetical protein